MRSQSSSRVHTNRRNSVGLFAVSPRVYAAARRMSPRLAKRPRGNVKSCHQLKGTAERSSAGAEILEPVYVVLSCHSVSGRVKQSDSGRRLRVGLRPVWCVCHLR
jgi:hypothetical protein